MFKEREGYFLRLYINKINTILTMTCFLVLSLSLTACGNDTGKEAAKQNVLVLASFDDTPYIREQVARYNQGQHEYQIEMKSYERSEQPDEGGILLLQREIALGKGPDIIDFGSGFTTSDIVGGYTEDLFSYMGEEENKYFENVLNAFSYEEKLYAIPLSFTLKSFVGTAQNLEGHSSWSIEEMMDCYQGQAKERLLYPGAFKKDVLGTILAGSMEYYINWETGECNFDGKEFSDVLRFCNQFPERLEITEDFSTKQIFLEDGALLLPVNIRSVYDMCKVEYIFNEQEITFIGFPVEGTSGTMIQSCGSTLAISRNSSHKEAAWSFISQCLSVPGQEELASGFPMCREVLEKQIDQALEIEYEMQADGTQQPVVKQEVIFEGEEKIDIYCISAEQAKRLISLIEGAEIASHMEPKIYNVFLEEAEYYFNGEKSLEETVDVIQSKISIYVSEKI